MDRVRSARGMTLLALLAALAVGQAAEAQRQGRVVYNPVTGRTEPERRVAGATPATPPAVRQAAAVEEPPLIEPVGMLAPCGCGDTMCGGCADLVCETPSCGADIGCGSTVACGPGGLYAGFEFTFVKPRFEKNVAFTTTQSDGVGNDVISDTEFDYDLVLTPRVYAGWKRPGGCGLRATWWQFDNDADPAAANPPANGFGQIAHPGFATVDIGSTVPGDTLTAGSHLNAYAIDIEATKETRFRGWDLGVAGGVRYAFAEQGYTADLRDAGDVLRGRIDYVQSIEGIGPTISLSAARPITRRASLYSTARGSLLFGDGESRLSAGEDLDLTVPFTTNRTTNRDDVLSIAEIQLGFRWRGDGIGCGPRKPFLSVAMEGQVWNGAGSATSEDGTLGFFGFTSQIGFDW